MFKLLYLKLEGHPQLKNTELQFTDDGSHPTSNSPYTSILIGANGSGKSLILRLVTDIFRNFAEKGGEKTDQLNGYAFHIRYQMDNATYDIVNRRLAVAERKGIRRSHLAFKNRPMDMPFYDMQDKLPMEKLPGYEIPFSDLKLPSRLLASAIFINDRFPFYNSQPENFYQYLGVRRTASATSTGTFMRKR